jgi:LacI family transcriptional regulator
MLSSLSRDGRYDSSAIAAWINEHRVDGIIFTSFGRTERPLVKGAAKAGLPVVFVAPDDLARVGVTVRSNNTDAGRAAGDHLADLGHQRIAFIGGPASSRDTRDRLAGVEHALRARSLRLDRDDVRFAKSYAAESGADEARALLASPKPWPTAIVVGNDALALGFMRVLLQNGVRIPADISVVGFDGIPEGARFWPALTTVAQPIVDMGAAACRTILERIDDPEIAGVSTVELPMTLEIRESTGPTAKYEQPTRISN